MYRRQLSRIRAKVESSEYFFTYHCFYESMAARNLVTEDVTNAILTGEIIRRLTHDSRGTRYVIEGETLDGVFIRIPVRFHESKKLAIITAFFDYEDTEDEES